MSTEFTTPSPGPLATETAEDLTLRGMPPDIDLRTLAAWMAVPSRRLENDWGPVTAEASLEGLWDLEVVIEYDPQTRDSAGVLRFDFRADHTVKYAGIELDDGLPAFFGIGWWISFPDGGFVFGIHHPGMPDGHGASAGAVYGMHRGHIVDGAIQTEAIAVIDQGADQPWAGPVKVCATGTRVER